MPDTRISKIQVRRGSIADLPLLDAGEFGYATDEQRLFIGNESLTIGSGDGSNTVFTMPSTSLYPADLETPVSYISPKFYLDNVEDTGVTVSGITVTFATAPANGAVVTTRFNSEVKLKTDFVVPGEETLTASASAGTQTAFQFDKTTYNALFMNYTLKKEYTAVVTGTVQNPTVSVGDTLEINGTTVSFTSTSNLTTMVNDINNVFAFSISPKYLPVTDKSLHTGNRGPEIGLPRFNNASTCIISICASDKLCYNTALIKIMKSFNLYLSRTAFIICSAVMLRKHIIARRKGCIDFACYHAACQAGQSNRSCEKFFYHLIRLSVFF